MANTSGGDLIIGIVENDDATPKEILGISISNLDEKILDEALLRRIIRELHAIG